MRTVAACDICLKVRNDTKHYTLQRAGRGHGAIDLCDACWERVGKPNMKPGRATRTKAQDDRRAALVAAQSVRDEQQGSSAGRSRPHDPGTIVHAGDPVPLLLNRS